MRALAVLLLTLPALAGCLGGDDAQWPETTPIVDPELPAALQVLVDASDPVLDAMPWAPLTDATNPISFGMTFEELGQGYLREFELAALYNATQDGTRPHPFHTYGHPDYNHAVARVPVTFDSDAGVELYGEIMLPERGAVPPSNGPFPTIIALEGLQGNLGMYRWWHQIFADAGYIVFAFDHTGQGHSSGSDEDTDEVRVADAQRALTYLLEESEVADFIDEDRIGVIGHSLGAFTALEWHDQDDRIHAIVAGAPVHESQIESDGATIPVMIQTGDHDGPIAPLPFVNPYFARTVYDDLTGDRAFIVAEATSHCQHTNYPMCPMPTWARPLAGDTSLAWMDWHLRGDDEARQMLLEAPDHLSMLWTSEVRLDGQTTVLAEGTLG